MPAHLKFVISIATLLLSAGMFWYDTVSGTPGAARWVVLVLGPMAVFAIWVFPEAQAKAIRKEAAQRRAV